MDCSQLLSSHPHFRPLLPWNPSRAIQGRLPASRGDGQTPHPSHAARKNDFPEPRRSRRGLISLSQNNRSEDK